MTLLKIEEKFQAGEVIYHSLETRTETQK